MNALTHLLSGQTVSLIGWTILHSLWELALVAILLAAVLRLARPASAGFRYLAACLVLVLMLAIPAGTLWVLRPAPMAQTQTLAEPVPVVSSSAPAVAEQPPAPVAAPKVSLPAVAPVPVPSISGLEQLRTILEPKLPWIVAVWLAGVVAFSLRLLLRWLWTQRVRSCQTRPVDALWQNKLDILVQKLRVSRPVRLLESALAEVPLVIGHLRPVILLPACALTGLSTLQLEAILAHELAHIRRMDYLVNLVQTLVETLLFYHPAVWYASRQIRTERENICDDVAVAITGDRLAYARALLAMEELRAATPSLALAAGGSGLLPRIRRLVERPNASTRIARPWGLGLFLIGLIAVSLCVSISTAKADSRVELLISQLSSPNELVRRGAAKDLGNLSDRQAVEPLIRALSDKERRVRKEAILALGKLKDPRAIEPLTAKLKDTSVQIYIPNSLAQIGGHRAVAALVDTLLHGNPRMRQASAQALTQTNWMPKAPAEQAHLLLALKKREQAKPLIPSAIQPATSNHINIGPFKLDLPILLNAQANDIQAQWIEFHHRENDLHAVLYVTYPSGPKARWRVVVTLYNAQRNVAAQAERDLENSGVIAGVAAIMEEDLIFDFGHNIDPKALSGFDLSIETLPQQSSPSATQQSENPPTTSAKRFCLQVLDDLDKEFPVFKTTGFNFENKRVVELKYTNHNLTKDEFLDLMIGNMLSGTATFYALNTGVEGDQVFLLQSTKLVVLEGYSFAEAMGLSKETLAAHVRKEWHLSGFVPSTENIRFETGKTGILLTRDGLVVLIQGKPYDAKNKTREFTYSIRGRVDMKNLPQPAMLPLTSHNTSSSPPATQPAGQGQDGEQSTAGDQHTLSKQPNFSAVIQAAQKVHTYSYTMTHPKSSSKDISKAVWYFKGVGQGRMVGVYNGEEQYIETFDLRKRLILTPTEKKALLIMLPKKATSQPAPSGSPLVALLRGYAAVLKPTPLGRKTVNQQEAFGYQFEWNKFRRIVWVDSQTLLPVQIEETSEIKDPTLSIANPEYRVKSDFIFNPPLDDSLFSTEPPKGYALEIQEGYKKFIMPETSFIDGLRQWAQLNGGQFPDALTLVKLNELLEKGGVSSSEVATSLNAVLDAVGKQHRLNPASWGYAGKGVKLGEKDKPVFGYRPDNATMYRVIYGDLSVKEVSKEQFDRMGFTKPAPQPTGSKLEFRIAAEKSSVPDLDQYISDLQKNGPQSTRQHGDDYQWFECNEDVHGASVQPYQGKKYILLSNRPYDVMLKGEWGLKNVYITKDNNGRPSLGFEFDDNGAARFGELTGSHINQPLAILIDDRVISAPKIMTRLSRRGLIQSNMTEKQFNDFLAGLKAGMVNPQADLSSPNTTQPATQPAQSINFDKQIPFRCSNCQAVVRYTIRQLQKMQKPGSMGPMMGPMVLDCPKCKKHALTQAVECPKCQAVFVMQMDPSRNLFNDKCPKCHTSYAKAWQEKYRKEQSSPPATQPVKEKTVGQAHPTPVIPAPASARVDSSGIQNSDQQNKGPFIATGKVTDEQGRPMAGVKVRASCGMGTLLPCGETFTGADGTYTLRFSGARQKWDKATQTWQVPMQIAVISPEKAGYYEKNLHRQGDLCISDKPVKNGTAWSGPKNTILPEKPFTLNFVMLLAAQIQGCVMDTTGKPVSDCTVWLKGDKLPPAASVFENTYPDKDGRFTVKDVPLQPYSFWFSIGGKNGSEITKAERFSLAEPGTYQVDLTFHNPWLFGKPRLFSNFRRMGVLQYHTRPMEQASQPMAFDLDQEIPVQVEIKNRIQVSKIKFEKLGDLLKANLNVAYLTYPHIQWEIQIRLLDESGKLLKDAAMTVDNGGIALGTPLWMFGKDYEVVLGAWKELSSAKQFTITIAKVWEKKPQEGSSAPSSPPATQPAK